MFSPPCSRVSSAHLKHTPNSDLQSVHSFTSIRYLEGIAVRGGIGFGRGGFSLNALELSLAQIVAPHETTMNDKVVVYD